MLLCWLGLTLAADLPPAADLDEDDTRVGEEIQRDSYGSQPALEIIVTDERIVQEARQEVEDQLVDMGYTKTRRRDDRTVYLHETGWRNKVIIHDDGWMYMRKRPPHIKKPNVPGAWWDGVPVVEWAPCLLNPFACVSAGTVAVRPKLSEQDKERVVETAGRDVVEFADAIAGRELAIKIFEVIPERLDAIWYEGVDPEGDVPYTSPEDRRRAILELWISRTDNEYGDAVRVAVEQYMLYEIQTSSNPYTPEEIAWANATRRCQRELTLEESPW